MSALLLKLGECERQGNHRTWWDTGVLDLLDVSEERDVRAYEMGRLKSDDSNLKEGIGFKMESLKYRADTFGFKYQPDTLGFTVKTRSRQTPAMTLWGLQRLLLIFSGLFPSHPQKINYSIRYNMLSFLPSRSGRGSGIPPGEGFLYY